MSAWSSPPLEFQAEVTSELELRVRELVKKIFEGIVERTPVDSGSLRASWRVAIGNMDTSVTVQQTNNPPLGPPSFSLGEFKVGDLIFISNSLPYVWIVEYGSSQQAPQGMVRVTLASLGVGV